MDLFLQIAAIEGESVDANHKKWIDLDSYQLGGSNSISIAGAGGAEAGKVSLSELTVTFPYDKTSPVLFSKLCSGARIDFLKLACRTKLGTVSVDFLVYEFTDVLVSSQSVSGASGDSKPSQSVSFFYTRIKQTYRQILGNGTVTPASQAVSAMWNLETNAP